MSALRKFFRFLTPLLLLSVFFGLLTAPQDCAAAVRDGLTLCAENLVPSLYPFFVLSSLTVSTGWGDALGSGFGRFVCPLFGIPPAGLSAWALGLVGGYPVGARTIAELYRTSRISRKDAERMLGFCCNAGPGFLLGICGAGIFQSLPVGLCLYGIHVAAAWTVGLLLRPGAGKPVCSGERTAAKQSLLLCFPSAIRASLDGILQVCALVVFFSVPMRLLRTLPILPPPFRTAGVPAALLNGLLEATGGVLLLPADASGFCACAFLLGWGGLSVHMQTLAALDGCSLSLRFYWFGKTMQAVFSLLFSVFLAPFLFPCAIP